MKVVIDTNVFISGVFFSGPPYQILTAWKDGRIRLALTAEIFDEYERVGKELAERHLEVDIKPMLSLLIVHADFYPPVRLARQVCEDPDDDKFLECALACGSKHIVSGDKHLLKCSGFGGIAVITPRNFVDSYLLSSP